MQVVCSISSLDGLRGHFPFIIHGHRWPRAIKTLCSEYFGKSGIRGKSRTYHLTYGNPARAYFPFIIHEHRWPRAIKTLCSDYDYVVDDVKLVSVSHGFLGRSVVASSAMAEAAFSRSPSSSYSSGNPVPKASRLPTSSDCKKRKISSQKSNDPRFYCHPESKVSSTYSISCGSTMSRTL